MRRAVLSALALCVVTAGCSGPLVSDATPAAPSPGASPTSTPTPTESSDASPTPTESSDASPTGTPSPTPPPTTTPADDAGVVAVEGSLAVNATAVWRRVLDLRGVDPTSVEPPTVVVENRGDVYAGAELPFVADGFARQVGVEEVAAENATGAWEASGRVEHGTVVVDPNGADPATVEAVLAHEFEHVLQVQRLGGHRQLPLGVSEGAAVYVADAYAEQHLDGVDPSARRRAVYEASPANAAKYVFAFVYFGYRYVDRVVEDPAGLAAVYADPPTDEQLLAGPGADDERASLTVRTVGEGWRRPEVRRGFGAWWRPPATVGPVFARVMLTEYGTESAAAEAVTGWGNGTLLAYDGVDGNDGTDGATGYLWVVRMDDRASATTLAAALRRHLDGIANRTGDGGWRANDTAYRLVRADAGALALAVGDPSFVASANATATGGTVTASTGD